MSVWRLSWRVSQHEPRSFWLGWTAFMVFFSMPAAIGWVLGRAFGSLTGGETLEVVRWALVLAFAELLRMLSLQVGAIAWTRTWLHMQTLLRANMLAAQLASGGAESGRPADSAAEAITHFRDDTEDVAMFVDGLVDVSGGLVFTAIAAFVLGATDLAAATVLLVPLTGVVVVTRMLDTRIKQYRAADRAATEAVTGLVGDAVAAATTIKVNDVVEPIVDRLAVLVERRRATAVRDRVLDEGVQAFSRGAADVGLGLVLLVTAAAMASGRFDVGQLALFAAYLGWLSFLPRMLGRVLARRKQAEVALDRMGRLVSGTDPTNVVRPRFLPIDAPAPRTPPLQSRPTRFPLERLDVVGLRVTQPSGIVLDDVSFTIGRGEIVVVTGPIGAGKTTLLRALLGLERRAPVEGSVRWNGVELDDRAAFLVPPNAAFLPQVPHLLSDTVVDNVGLGPLTGDQFARAVRLAVFDEDLALMANGSRTVIGPRGLRLSGGQRQRLAAARALVHLPELVVLDDLSSALDVETELALWDNVRAAGLTVIAVSHRSVALERADRVVHLRGGRQVDPTPGRTRFHLDTGPEGTEFCVAPAGAQ